MSAATSLEHINFPYPRLDHGSRQIRLLVISRSKDGTGRRYALRGNGPPDHTIEIDGKLFDIRMSIHDFLQTMSVDKLCGAWFIDAICINQADLVERAAQVRLMGILYSRAHEVVAWLGLDHHTSHSGLWLRTQILRAWTMHPTAELGDLLRWLRMGDARMRTILSAKRASSRPYWTRLWVVQEVLLAKRLRIMLGNYGVPVKSVIALSEGNHFHNWRSEYWSVRSRPASWLTAYGEQNPVSSHDKHQYPLYKALITFGTQESLDPSDTVFGLLGLAKTNIVPDYDLTTTDLWLYALVEGLHNIELESQSLLEHNKHALGHDFVQACALALDFSPQHITVAIISRMAIRLCLPAMVVITGYSSWEATIHHRPRSTRWHYLCQNVALLSRTQARRLGCTGLRKGYQVWVWRLIYQLQTWFLALLRYKNYAIPMPDGRQYTYADWEVRVEKTLDLVKHGRPPQPSPAGTLDALGATVTVSPEHMPSHLMFRIQSAGCASSLVANIACGLLFACLGAAIGSYADSTDTFRRHPWATDDWVWNFMAPFMLLSHYLDIFTTAGRYPLAAHITAEWGGIWSSV